MTCHCVETVYGFRIIPAYLRTYHNVTADALTRDTPEAIAEMGLDLGLEVADIPEDWASFFERGWVRRTFTFEYTRRVSQQHCRRQYHDQHRHRRSATAAWFD